MANVRSLLIVSADPKAMEGLRISVNRLGTQWKFLEARNLSEAKTAAERSRPDIILVNHKLPLDGVRVVQSMLAVAPASAILFLTEDNSMIHGAFAAGALGYLHRNQVETDLLPAIEQLLLGRTFFTAEAVRLIRVYHHQNPYPGEHTILSPREVTILQQIALGTPNKVIARKCDISVRTVENHRAAIMEKLELQNLSDLVRYAVRTGLIEA